MCWFMPWHSEWLWYLLGITSLYQWDWGGKRLGIHSGSSLDFMTPGCILHCSVFLLPEKVWKNHAAIFPARSEPDSRLLVGFHPISSNMTFSSPFFSNSRQVNGCYWRLIKKVERCPENGRNVVLVNKSWNRNMRRPGFQHQLFCRSCVHLLCDLLQKLSNLPLVWSILGFRVKIPMSMLSKSYIVVSSHFRYKLRKSIKISSVLGRNYLETSSKSSGVVKL